MAKEKVLNEFILHRSEHNPLISPTDFPGGIADSVMNCGQVIHDGKVTLLVAVIYRGRLNGAEAGIHVATSEDGIHFEINPEPLCKPVDWAPGWKEMDRWVIDPRVTKIDDTYYIMRPGQCRPTLAPVALLEKTKDFKSVEYMGCVALPENRVPCLFPEKVNGRYVRLDRPYATKNTPQGGIWISYSPDLIHWGDHKPLLMPWGAYFGLKVGPTPPIKTKHGWLEIFHGVWRNCANDRYSLSAMLLDLEDPSKIIGKMESWILTPQADYERLGNVNNVVFACGALADEEKDEIRVYYGAADEHVCLATGSLSELIDACKKGL